MKRYFFLFLVLYLFAKCKNSEINKQIVIKIGELEITNYELERNRSRELLANSKDSSILKNTRAVEEWTRKYIDKCYIIADAYKKKYDTISAIQGNVKSVGNFMMTQKYGYLWKRIISPIVDTAKIVTEAKIEKRKKIFYFEYISSKDILNFQQVLNKDSVLTDKEEFFELKRNCINKKNFSSGYFSIQWPFLALWDYKDYLFLMKEGQVSKPIHSGKEFLYLYLDHIEEIPINDNEKGKLFAELQLGTESDLIKKRAAEMEARCKPQLNQTNINTIAVFLEKGKNITQFEQDLELIQYQIDGSLRKIGVNTFLNYYSQLVVRNEIKNKDELVNYIMNYYDDDYSLNEARKLNLFESDVFKLDQKNYLNNILFVKYLENEILNKIKIDSLEKINYYQNNLSTFKQPKQVTVNLYYFKNSEDAGQNKSRILQLIQQNELAKINDTSIINGLIKLKSNLNIDLENANNYSSEFLKALSNTEPGNMNEWPILYENHYVLLYYKKALGESYKKFKDVSGFIEYKLKDEKSQIELEKLMSGLKKEYKLEVNKTRIDY